MPSISLETLETARPLLAAWGLRDAERGWRNLAGPLRRANSSRSLGWPAAAL